MGGDPCNHASTQPVKIEGVDDKNVSFSTRSASLSGDPHESLLRTFTVPLAELYTKPIKGTPPPVELAKGRVGCLYLSRAGWEIKSPDGFNLYGKDQVLFKIPDCAAATVRLLTNLSVIPTSIIVRGHLEGETEFFDVELLGPDAAESQAIHWNGADYVDVRLTSRGARRLRLQSRSTTAKIWPISINIKGAPAIDQAVSGAVDVLRHEMADGNQAIVFGKPGAPVTLCLTQDGVSAFHLTPQAVAELSGGIGPATQPCCPGCVQQELERTRKRASGVTRRRSLA